MSIKDQFAPYVDGNGLMSNAPVLPGSIRASDNGPLFTSQYIIMLKKSGELTLNDITTFQRVIGACVDDDMHLHRAPSDPTPDAPDDYYGVAAAFSQLEITSNIKLPLDMWRQPQLVFAMMASNQILSRWKFWQWPLAIYTALVVLTSCINVEPGNTDERILSWLLIQATKESSVLVKLASIIWFHRLFSTYGPTGMKAVAGIYFLPQGNNPYQANYITR